MCRQSQHDIRDVSAYPPPASWLNRDGCFVETPTRRQSRRGSMLETVTSTAIGFIVSLVLTAAVLPAFGYPTTWAHDFWITCIFTVASIVRGYVVRRLFNR